MRKILAVLLCFAAWPVFGATCKISEYTGTQSIASQLIQVAQEPAAVVQNITYTTTTQSTAFGSNTRFVRIVCDAKAHFEFGTNPTATANDPYLAADTPEYFGIAVDSTIEVAFYDGSS